MNPRKRPTYGTFPTMATRRVRVLCARFRVATPLGFAVVLFAGLVVLVVRWWWRMEHVLHLANASSTQAHTIRVVLDSQPMVSHDVRLEPDATDTIRFSARAEAGYVFFVVDGESQFELGRCGHTDKRTNEYRVRIAPGQPFVCTELPTAGPWPF